MAGFLSFMKENMKLYETHQEFWEESRSRQMERMFERFEDELNQRTRRIMESKKPDYKHYWNSDMHALHTRNQDAKIN